MKKECWKPLIYKEIDLSDRFLVSNYGEIYSLKSKKNIETTVGFVNGVLWCMCKSWRKR